jgi:hypothetical protein
VQLSYSEVTDRWSRLIAIMLGRLKMTVEECIEKYNDMCERIFANKGRPVQVRNKGDRRYNPRGLIVEMKGAFDHTILEACIMEAVSSGAQGVEDAENILLNNGSSEGECKVYVGH